MGNSFDISLERLTGKGVPGGMGSAGAGGVVSSGRLAVGLAGLKPGTYRGETLEGGLRPGAAEEPKSTDPSQLRVNRSVCATEGTFFLETFGCQMNDHDSEKVAGVLLARGYRQVESPDMAAVILYNTCSIREKAAQKIFSRLGEYRFTKKEGQVIGVLG